MKTTRIEREQIESEIKYNKDKLDEALSSGQSHRYRFEWRMESILQHEERILILQHAKTHGIDSTIEMLTTYMMKPYNSRKSSSCKFTNLAHEVTNEIKLQMIEWFKQMYRS